MNRRTGRIIRITLMIGSFVVGISLGVPWVDEYIQRRNDADELTQLRDQLEESTKRDQRLSQVADQLELRLRSLALQQKTPDQAGELRDNLTEIIRASGAQLRHIDVSPGLVRPWGRNDDPRTQVAIVEREDTGFDLTSLTIDIRAAGSISAIEEILRGIAARKWLVTTNSMLLTPSNTTGTEITLELRVTAFGLKRRVDEQPQLASALRMLMHY